MCTELTSMIIIPVVHDWQGFIYMNSIPKPEYTLSHFYHDIFQTKFVFSSFSPLLYLIAFHLSRLLSASMLHVSCPYSPSLTLPLVSTCGFLSSFTIYTHTHLFTHMQTLKVKICTWERMWFSFWAFVRSFNYFTDPSIFLLASDNPAETIRQGR